MYLRAFSSALRSNILLIFGAPGPDRSSKSDSFTHLQEERYRGVELELSAEKHCVIAVLCINQYTPIIQLGALLPHPGGGGGGLTAAKRGEGPHRVLPKHRPQWCRGSSSTHTKPRSHAHIHTRIRDPPSPLSHLPAKSPLRNAPLSGSPSLSCIQANFIFWLSSACASATPDKKKRGFSQILLVLTGSKSFHLPLTRSACHLRAPNYSGGLHTQSEHFLPNFPGRKIKCGLREPRE